MIKALYDEVCHFCKEPIEVEIDAAMLDGEVYECDCGAEITITFDATLGLSAKGKKPAKRTQEDKSDG